MIDISVAALGGIAVLLASVGWFLWRESVTAEESMMGGLAATLGARTEAMILDTQRLLANFDALPAQRCSAAHLKALEDATIGRPYIRAIGYWRASERQCGVGFLQARVLKPPRADRIYKSGVIAWWPSRYTEVGGTQLFLMRFGNHDAAIDPRVLLDIGPLQQRQAGLWVEKLRLASQPADADLPLPGSVRVGLTLDRQRGRAISRFSRSGVLPIEVVAIEPLETFWGRYARTLGIGIGIGLLLVAGWLYALMRYTRHRLSIGTVLRHAITHDRIHAHYQPMIELATGRCVGAEALARWTMEGGHPISPETFVPIAEDEGISSDLTKAVLTWALRDLRGLLLASPGLSVNINLSPEDLKTERFALDLEEGLAACGLPPRAVKLEVTERALINTDSVRSMIRRLRERGHEVALDDFGTGYSSLSHLSSLELDMLKIDKSFVDAIGTGAATSHVIVHVIEMARELGLRTVAEGVQTEEQRRWLIDHGVEYGQGWLFSAPLTPEAFVDFARKSQQT